MDGANTFRAETVSQYVQGVHNTMLHDPATGLHTRPSKYTADIEDRYMYNPTFESIYSIVPSVPPLLLVLIPAILMTVSIVREKELGSMINFYVTPTGRMEYLLGKQLPYIAIGMINFFILGHHGDCHFRRPDQGQLSDVDVLHAALRHDDDGHRHGDFDLHEQPGRRRVRHRDSHHSAHHPVFRTAAAGFDPRRPRQVRRFDLADNLLHALERGRLHQGAQARSHDAGRDFSGLLHSDSLGCEHDRFKEAGEVAVTSLLNIFWLGLKELRSLGSDLVMMLFVIYAFTGTIYIAATGTSSEVNNASIAFADEDGSALSKELFNAFYPPRFQTPETIAAAEVETTMDQGRFMFVVIIPPRFETDLRAGRNPDIQVNIDATAMQQAGIGANYIKNIINDRISSFLTRTDASAPDPVNLVVRKLFNPNG